jgi:hypothetical protein
MTKPTAPKKGGKGKASQKQAPHDNKVGKGKGSQQQAPRNDKVEGADVGGKLSKNLRIHRPGRQPPSSNADSSANVNTPPSRPRGNNLIPELDTEAGNNVSYAHVFSPPRTVDDSNTVSNRVQASLSPNEDIDDEFQNDHLPELKSLSSEAVRFFSSIYSTPSTPSLQHALANLADFASIFTSVKLALLAKQKLNNGMLQFRVRYFGGLFTSSTASSGRDDPNLLVARQIRTFFTSIFNNPDNDSIEDCTRRARTIYITCSTVTSGRRDDTNVTERIIAAINFAYMDDDGFFVNWLATANDDIIQRKYGSDLHFLLGHGTWQRHNLSSFLLRLTNLIVIGNLRVNDQLTNYYFIALQANVQRQQRSADFYHALGFEEKGPVETEVELDTNVFEGFRHIQGTHDQSNTDYIHFMWNAEDIVVFVTPEAWGLKTGMSLCRQYSGGIFPDNPLLPQNTDFEFPFIVRRDILSLLATNLDFFYIPFDHGVNVYDFAIPDPPFEGTSTNLIRSHDFDVLRDPKGWIENSHIDFFVDW